MVPGYNDAENQIKATADFLKSIHDPSIELLKYHNMYEDKAKRLGIEQEPLNITPEQSLESIKNAIVLVRSLGISAACFDLDASRHRAEFTKRVHDIQKAIRESGHHLCFEASRLKTEYYRKNGFGKPTPIHRSERLAHVLANK